MSKTFQCEILDATQQPYLTYKQLYNSDDKRVDQSGYRDGDNTYTVYSVYSELDRTPELNCLIDWKNDLTNIVESQSKNIDFNAINNGITEIHEKINRYSNKIKEIDGLKQSLNAYNKTKLDYIDQEFEVERQMQKKLLEDYIKRARKDRLDAQNEFDNDTKNLKASQQEELDTQRSNYERTMDTNKRQFEDDKEALARQYTEELKIKQEEIDDLEQKVDGFNSEYNDAMDEMNSKLEDAKKIIQSKDEELLSGLDKFDLLKDQYKLLETDNGYLEKVSQKAHNINTKSDIQKQIDDDMQIINNIQTMYRDGFTNMVHDNKSHFLLGLGLLSAGFIIYRMNK